MNTVRKGSRGDVGNDFGLTFICPAPLSVSISVHPWLELVLISVHSQFGSLVALHRAGFIVVLTAWLRLKPTPKSGCFDSRSEPALPIERNVSCFELHSARGTPLRMWRQNCAHEESGRPAGTLL